ncbi:MAG: acyltransferase family protein [Rhodospirillaceae bacterium]
MTTAALPAAQPATPAGRILALDIFRGMTIAFMIIVNTPGNGSVAWGPLNHASWHGFTPTDLVFPSFLFAIGTSAWFSLKRFGHRPSGAALAKIWRRTAILFLIGVFMWYVPGFVASLFTLTPGAFLADLAGRIRIMGVLQRLALCYGIGATLALYLSRRMLIAAGGGILMLYWALMWGFGQGPDPYALQTNAALRLDAWLLGPAHLYHGERVDGVRFAFDPEGILSTLPAIVTFIIGYLTGRFLDQARDRRQALVDLLPTACLLIAAGFIWSEWFGFPINKKLWTSSYTLYAGGWSMLVLGLVMWAVDVHGKAGPLTFFNVFGRNPLLAYITSEVGAVCMGMIRVTGADGMPQSLYAWVYRHAAVPVAGDTAAGSFLFAAGFVLVNWVVAWACYRRGVIIKV